MIKKILFLFFLLFMTVTQSIASTLPENLSNYIKNTFPNSKQRFDSVIELQNDIMYIPLYPAVRQDVEKIEVEYTYPKGLKLSSLPEVIIFNDNFVLLKVFKDKTGTYSITQNENLPLKVRLGVMPQDMLVPAGLKIPESLKVLLGDLRIPTKNEGSVALDNIDLMSDNDKKSAEHRNFNKKIIPIAELLNKKMLVSSINSKFVSVYDLNKSDTLYELKLNGIPSEIISSNNSKFALVMYFKSKNVEVIDLKNERIITTIELPGIPKSAIMDEVHNLAYVTCPENNSISVIDMNSTNVVKEIKVSQTPTKLAINKAGNMLAFNDYTTQKIYTLTFGEEYEVKQIGTVSNISNLFLTDSEVYAISRSDNKIYAFSFDSEKIYEEDTGKKPVDAIQLENNIYILCAQDSVIDVFDSLNKNFLEHIKLPKEGFWSKLLKVTNTNNAIVSGVETKSFLLFDLKNAKILKKQPFEFNVSKLIVVDK